MYGVTETVGTAVLLFAGYLLYSYLTFRDREVKSVKAFFTPIFRRREAGYLAVIVSVALAAGIYGYRQNGCSTAGCCLNMLMIFLLAAMAWVDLREKRIPNILILAGLALWTAEMGIGAAQQVQIGTLLWSSVLGGCVWGGLLALICLATKADLGMGDARMFAVIGLSYGLHNTCLVLLVSLIMMALVSVVLLMLRRVDRRTSLPMAPFVLTGFVFCVFVGMQGNFTGGF